MRAMFYIAVLVAVLGAALAAYCLLNGSGDAGVRWVGTAVTWAFVALIAREGCDFSPRVDRAQKRYEEYQSLAIERHSEALAAHAAARRKG